MALDWELIKLGHQGGFQKMNIQKGKKQEIIKKPISL